MLISSVTSENARVQVAIRCRPMIQKELLEGCQEALEVHPVTNQISISGDSRIFTFDYVFAESAPQLEVYETCIAPLLDNLFNGFNITVLAYGQTGSGKTHTMGTEVKSSGKTVEQEIGIIPRLVNDLFSIANNRDNLTLTVGCSFVEIYNDQLVDLLNGKKCLTIRQNNDGIMISNLREAATDSPKQILDLLEYGVQTRSTGATAMNQMSSRSHAVFTLYCSVKRLGDNGEDLSLSSKCHLVDLAGSERLDKTQSTGERQKEGININMGLFCLGKVIEALTVDSKGKQKFIPYRDHILTRLLQDSLGGNSLTMFIACVSPADSNSDESMNTLKYAEKASRIKNKPIINQDPNQAELMKLRQEVRDLKQRLGLSTVTALVTIPNQLPVLTQTASALEAEIKELKARLNLVDQEKFSLQENLESLLQMNSRHVSQLDQRDGQLEKIMEAANELKTNLNDLIDELPNENRECSFQFHNKLKLLLQTAELIHTLAECQTTECDDTKLVNCDETWDPQQGTERQFALSVQVAELDKEIINKQLLAKEVYDSSAKLSVIRLQHEKEVKELEAKVDSFKTERDQLHEQLRTAQNSTKLSEQRRKKLQEVESELSQAKQQLKNKQALLKLKQSQEETIKKLEQEIKDMKQVKVKLIKQLKEENQRFQQFKQNKDKEMNRLLQKEKRQKFEAFKAKQEYERQINVFKRKYEEAVAVSRRLQQQHVQRTQAQQSKISSADVNEKVSREIKSLVMSDLEYQISVEEAKAQKQQLIEQRRDLCFKKQDLQSKIDMIKQQPPRKKQAIGEERDASQSDDDLQVDFDRLYALEKEIQLRSDQIKEISSQIMAAENDDRDKGSCLNKLFSLAQARAALRYAFQFSLDTHASKLQNERKLKEVCLSQADLEEKCTDLMQQLRDREKNLKHIKEEKSRNENKQLIQFCSMVRQILTSGEKIDTVELKNYFMDQLQQFEDMNERLQRSNEEKSEMQKELASARLRGNRQGKLFKSVSTANINAASNENENKTPKRSRSSRLIKPVDRLQIVNEIEVDADLISSDLENDKSQSFDSNDPDYRETPIAKQRKTAAQRPLKKSIEPSCGCHGQCSSQKCSCKKNGRKCNSQCSCVDCTNRTEIQLLTPMLLVPASADTTYSVGLNNPQSDENLTSPIMVGGIKSAKFSGSKSRSTFFTKPFATSTPNT